MNKYSVLTWIVAALCFTVRLDAQVPSTLNYQGRIAVSGVNFTGAGQFKFALVDAAGNQTFWSNDGTSVNGGQPTAAVSIAVSSGLYSVLLGDTALVNMTAVPATVFANPNVHLRVWFSDGVNGFQQMTPDQKIAAVGYAMMANTVPDGSITAAKLAPGVGGGGGTIADGSITAAKLASGAAAENLVAGNLSAVAAGGVIGSTDANNAALLAQGFVRDPASIASDGQWIPMPSGDTVAAHTAVWTGTELLIWGGVEPAVVTGISTYAAINRGIRYNPTTGAWTPISTVGAPQARFGHSAVWTGTKMVIWGGQTTGSNGTTAMVLSTGGCYDPATNTWSSMSPNVDNSGPPPGIPDARRGHLAFWTGSEMLIWGGSSSTQFLGSTGAGTVSLPGRRYNLATNTWSSMAATNIELATVAGSYSGVWTGSEMIVWAGAGGPPGTPPRAGRYSPTVDAWQALPNIPGDPAVSDSGFTTVWAGSQMLVWGGSIAGTSYTNAGYRFDPAGNAGAGSWASMSTAGAPTQRARHYALVSGSEMIVWGGYNVSGPPTPVTTMLNDGGRYNAITDSWLPISTTDAAPSRSEATVTIAGDKMIVWAGVQTDPGFPGMSFKFLKHGGVFEPATDVWSKLSNGSPAPRFGHTAVWTGTDLIVWGGTITNMSPPSGVDATFNDGAKFNPMTGVWTHLSTSNAPSGRYGHTAVWTGTEMIVWGGQRFDASGGPGMPVTLNTAAKYNPLTDTWTTVTNAFPPSARSKHTAVWAGSPVNRMIVWGGSSDGVTMAVNTGGVYDPASNTWSAATTLTNAPMATSSHRSLWTGSEMIVFGGDLTAGSRYYPLTNSWLTMATTPTELGGAPGSTPASVWTGGEMLVFRPGTSAETSVTATYSPIADFWQTFYGAGAPTGDSFSTPNTVWTGDQMIIWGVYNAAQFTSSGGRYSPATGTWSSLETAGAPATSYGTSAWTGTEMLLWGGTSSSGATNGTTSDKGHRYRLPQNYYLYRRP